MSCTIQNKTENFLKEQEIISETNELLDPGVFRLVNDSLSDLAFTKYNVGNPGQKLFNVKNNMVSSNTKLFELLDESTFYHEVQEVITFEKGVKDVTDESIEEETLTYEEVVPEKLDAFQAAKTEFTTLKDHFEYTLGRLDTSLIQNVERLRRMVKKAEKDGKEKTAVMLSEKIATLNNIRGDVESSIKTNTALGLVNYIEAMTSILSFIDNQLKNIDTDNVDGAIYLLTEFDDYLTTFSVVTDIQNLLNKYKKDTTQDMFTAEELRKLTATLDTEVGRVERLHKELTDFKKDVLFQKLNHVKYFPQILHKYREKLKREHEALNLPSDKDAYINENIAIGGKEWDNIQADVEDMLKALLENPIFDIKGVDKTFTSISNISTNLVQIFHRKLIELDNERIKIERKEDLKMLEVYDNLVAEKGTTNVNILYANITTETADGRKYLKGDYDPNFLIEVQKKLREIRDEWQVKIDEKYTALQKLKKAVGNTVEYATANKEYKAFVKERDDIIEKFKNDNLNFDKDNKATPKEKWATTTTNLSPAEKAALEYYRDIIDQGDKLVWNSDTLKKYAYGAYFYELPKVSKSSLERMYAGNILGSIKEKWDYLVETRADDTEYTNEDVDLAGKKHRQLRLHYRDRGSNFKNSLQSMDLATVFRLEFKNINIYRLRQQKEMELSFLIDIAKNQKFYSKNGSFLKRNKNNEKLNITTDENSNLVQMLTNMMDYRFYDISNSVDQKWGKIDANKAVGYINAVSAFMALSLNYASGTANVINANAQMFLETFIKGSTFNAKGIAKANSIYGKDLGATLQDNLRGINKSYSNQIAELFNVRGLFNLSESNFLQSTLLKKGMSLKSLQVFQDSGEHWIQSVLTMAILDNVKVMNADNKFINKDGEVVKTKTEAASLLDMLKPDSENGLVDLDSKVVFTTHSPNVKWNDGGKELIDILIRKKVDDSIGNYTQTQQAEAFRHYGGRLFLLYRKYLVPMGQARLLGWETMFEGELREDQKRFSHALQEYEEGTYTTLVRYGYHSLKTFKTELTTRSNWKNLSDYEKHNIKRAVTEIVLTSLVIPWLIELGAMGASAMDDDDKQRMYFIMYQLRRLMTELNAYRSVDEMLKMLKSPIPSTRFIEASMDIFEQSFPANWFETNSKGENLWINAVNEFNPGRQFGKDFENTFNWQNSNKKLPN